MMRQVRAFVSTVRWRANAVRWASQIGVVVTALSGGLLVSISLDLVLTLPWLGRASLLAAAVILAWRWVRRRGRRGLNEDDAALLIERRAGLRHSPIISAIQLERTTESPLLRTVAEDAHALLERLEPRTIVPAREVSIWPVVGTSLAALLAAGVMVRPDGSLLLLARALLVPGVSIPTATRLELLVTDPLRVRAGDGVVLRVRAQGVRPETGSAELRFDGGVTERLPVRLDPDDPSVYAVTVAPPAGSFSYVINVNDATVGPHRVERVVAPEVAGLDVRVRWPDYTGRESEVRSPAGLSVLAGSRIGLEIEATSAVALTGNVLRIEPDGPELPLSVDVQQPNRLHLAELLDPGDAGTVWRGSIRLRDEHGFESRGPGVIEIQVDPDKPPTVAWMAPTSQALLVTPRAKPRLALAVADDLGLSTVSLRTLIRRTGTYPAMEGDGLTMTAYAKPDLTGASVSSQVDQVAQDFSGDAPHPGLPADLFSVRWDGLLMVPETGRYTLRAEVDDHVRVWIDDTVVFATSIGQNLVSRPISLESGLRRLRVDLREDYGGAFLRLAWRRDGGRFEVIPKRFLFVDESSLSRARDGVAQRELLWTTPVSQHVTEMELTHTLNLSSLNVQSGDVLECWIEATDSNDITGPGVGRSSVLSVRIGTDAQVRDAILGRLGDFRAEIERIEQRQTRARMHTDEGGPP
jgi:hypothetical protein